MKKLNVALNVLKIISLVIALLSIFFMVYVLVDLNARVNAGEHKGLDNLAYVIVIIYSGIANLISFIVSLIGLIIASANKRAIAKTCEEQDCGELIASRKRAILHFALIIVLVLIATAFMFFVGPGLLPKA